MKVLPSVARIKSRLPAPYLCALLNACAEARAHAVLAEDECLRPVSTCLACVSWQLSGLPLPSLEAVCMYTTAECFVCLFENARFV